MLSHHQDASRALIPVLGRAVGKSVLGGSDRLRSSIERPKGLRELLELSLGIF